MWGSINIKQGRRRPPQPAELRRHVGVAAGRRGGFTLIELLIALVILAIITVVAVPNYMDYMVRGRLSQGTGTLSTLATQLEKAYLDQRSYADPDDAGQCAVAMPQDPQANFTFSCAPGNGGHSYLLTASNRSNHCLGAVGSYQFTLDQTGQRGTTFFAGSEVNRDCWMLTEGGCP